MRKGDELSLRPAAKGDPEFVAAVQIRSPGVTPRRASAANLCDWPTFRHSRRSGMQDAEEAVRLLASLVEAGFTW